MSSSYVPSQGDVIYSDWNNNNVIYCGSLNLKNKLMNIIHYNVIVIMFIG